MFLKSPYKKTLIASVLACLSQGIIQENTDYQAQKKTVPLTIFLRTSKKVFSRNEPITVEAYFSNTSNEPIKIGAVTDGCLYGIRSPVYHLEIKDETENTLPRKMIGICPSVNPPNPNDFLVLDPGRSYKLLESDMINLEKLVEFDKTTNQRYTVSLTYENPEKSIFLLNAPGSDLKEIQVYLDQLNKDALHGTYVSNIVSFSFE